MAIVYDPKIRCGSCGSYHRYVIQVRACYGVLPEGTFPCSWLTEALLATGDPDEPYYPGIVECGAPAHLRADGTGYDCEAGHEHTTAEARQAQGWEYCSDTDEAKQLARVGVEPRTMTGQIWPW
jgi:hypothetical protein